MHILTVRQRWAIQDFWIGFCLGAAFTELTFVILTFTA